MATNTIAQERTRDMHLSSRKTAPKGRGYVRQPKLVKAASACDCWSQGPDRLRAELLIQRAFPDLIKFLFPGVFLIMCLLTSPFPEIRLEHLCHSIASN